MRGKLWFLVFGGNNLARLAERKEEGGQRDPGETPVKLGSTRAPLEHIVGR